MAMVRKLLTDDILDFRSETAMAGCSPMKIETQSFFSLQQTKMPTIFMTYHCEVNNV